MLFGYFSMEYTFDNTNNQCHLVIFYTTKIKLNYAIKEII